MSLFLFCKAASRLWQVFWVIRLPLLCHLYYPSSGTSCHLPARSIATSPLWLKTVTRGLFLRCFAPPRRAPKGEGFKTVSPCGQVFGVVVYERLRFSRWGFLDGEPPPAGGLARVRGRRFVSTRLPRFARNDNVIRVYAWFYNVNPYKSPLTPLKFVIPRERSNRGNLAEAERKQRRPNYYNYSWTVVIVSIAGDFSTASRRRRVGWRGFVGGVSFPRDCRASLAMTM